MHWTLIIKHIHTGKIQLFEQVWLEIIMKTNYQKKLRRKKRRLKKPPYDNNLSTIKQYSQYWNLKDTRVCGG